MPKCGMCKFWEAPDTVGIDESLTAYEQQLAKLDSENEKEGFFTDLTRRLSLNDKSYIKLTILRNIAKLKAARFIGTCHRYPESQSTKYSYYCGEHKNREDV